MISHLTNNDLLSLPELQPSGWDDITSDYARFIKDPNCQALKINIDDKIVAIGATIAHADTVWLAKIVTHPHYRHRGLGAKITQALLDTIDREHYQTVYLEATDLGYPVYQKLGFEVETLYLHFDCSTFDRSKPSHKSIILFEAKYSNALLALDRQISGEDRSDMVKQHIEQAQLFVKNGILQGFYMPTLQNGLIVAANQQAGIALMELRLQKREFAIFPIDNLAALDFLFQHQIRPYKASRRMRLGKQRALQLHGLFNRISGQLG
jgi:GNAT superfamily N-acetyltransferase